MNKSKERAWQIIDLYKVEVSKFGFVRTVILVGSLSDDTYTGALGSDIDLINIVSDDVTYEEEQKLIFDLIDEIEAKTDKDIKIAKVVYQEKHLNRPFQCDFEINHRNNCLINLPIELSRILDGGIVIFGDNYINKIRKPTRDDFFLMEYLNKVQMEKIKKEDPAFYRDYCENIENPSIRILVQIVITTAMTEYYYYTNKFCSSKYRILELMEKDFPKLSYINLLKLCHKYRFNSNNITKDDIEVMRVEYKDVFRNRSKPWEDEEAWKRIVLCK